MLINYYNDITIFVSLKEQMNPLSIFEGEEKKKKKKKKKKSYPELKYYSETSLLGAL